jgi:hypothetical protein
MICLMDWIVVVVFRAASFIRFIYNRIILENAVIRASAVAALAKFGAQVPTLRPSIITLLSRCQDDDDDEVRDRATLHIQTLKSLQEAGQYWRPHCCRVCLPCLHPSMLIHVSCHCVPNDTTALCAMNCLLELSACLFVASVSHRRCQRCR